MGTSDKQVLEEIHKLRQERDSIIVELNLDKYVDIDTFTQQEKIQKTFLK